MGAHMHTLAVFAGKIGSSFPQTADVNVTRAALTWVWNSKQLVTKRPAPRQRHKAGQLQRGAHLCLVNMCSRRSRSLDSTPRLAVPRSLVNSA